MRNVDTRERLLKNVPQNEMPVTTSWAKRGDVGLDVFDRVQDSLTVDMIMTHRNDLVTCRREDFADAVAAGNKKGRYSFLPVVDENDQILGLYRAEQWFDEEAPDQPIDECFERLSEDLVIGADASILEFVTTTDERPARLVVSGHRIVGLLHSSDLQQLPVRAALFTLITSLEMAMAERIRTEWPNDGDGWLELLNSNQQTRIRKDIESAISEERLVNRIACTQIFDKADIIREKQMVALSESEREKIRKFRDYLTHANYYAETRKEADRLPDVVRMILRIRTHLLQGLAEPGSNSKHDSAAG